MKNFSKFCRKCIATSVLVLALACSAFAGEIPYPGVTAPPPATTNGDVQYPTVASSSETTDGDMPFPGVAADAVAEMALALYQGALALF